jgi:uncharacterized membrane protein YebE (DUF533 family)
MLGREIFLALTAIGWADGTLDEAEAAAITRAAEVHGLDGDDLAAVVEATKVRFPVDRLDCARLAPNERAFVYAVAVWIARLDGRVDESERVALRSLADRLGLDPLARTRASAAAVQVAQLPASDRPARFDLDALRRALEIC